MSRQDRVEDVYDYIAENPRCTIDVIAEALWLRRRTCIYYVHELRTAGRVKRTKLSPNIAGFVWEVGSDNPAARAGDGALDQVVRSVSEWEPMKLPPDPWVDALCRR